MLYRLWCCVVSSHASLCWLVGVPVPYAMGTLRLSVGLYNTPEQIDYAIQVLAREAVSRMPSAVLLGAITPAASAAASTADK